MIDLEEGRRLLAAATPGPWRHEQIEPYDPRWVVTDSPATWGSSRVFSPHTPPLPRDAELIVWFRNHGAELIARLETAAAEIEAYKNLLARNGYETRSGMRILA